MATTDDRVRIYDKAFISTIGLGQKFFDFLQKFTKDGLHKIWPDSGIFGATGIMSSVANDTVSVSALSGIWNSGLLCEMGSQGSIPFENSIGINYYVGALFNEFPSTIAINPLTANPEYIYVEEGVGELNVPDEVIDNGTGTLTIVVDSITEALVNCAGRTVRVWLTTPVSTAAGWFESATVQYGDPVGWGFNKNYIVTSAIFGQGTASTVITDYQVFTPGISIFRNKDLSDRILNPEYIYLGFVLGNGPGAIPATFDTTGVTVYYPVGNEFNFLREFVGKPGAGPIMPSYASINYISQGDDLVGAISDLDAFLNTIDVSIAASLAHVADSVADLAMSAASMAHSWATMGVVAQRVGSFASQISWTFDHNLNNPDVLAQCWESDEIVQPAKIERSGNNRIIARWSDPLGKSVAGTIVVHGKPGP